MKTNQVRDRLQQSSSFIALLIQLLNVFVIVVSLLAVTKTYAVYKGHPIWNDDYLFLALLGGLLFQFLNHRNATSYTSYSVFKLVKNTYLNWFFCVLIIMSLSFFMKKSSDFSRVSIGLWFFLTPIFLLVLQYFFFVFFNLLGVKISKKIKIVILGAGDLGEAFLKTVKKNNWLNYEIVGFYDDKKKKSLNGVPILGNIQKALSDAKKSKWQRVFIALPLRYEKKINRIISILHEESPVLVDLIPDIFRYQLFNPEWNIFNNLPIISLHSAPIKGFNVFVKKVEDIAFSLVIMILISPLFLSIALLVKLTSKGPIFFVQNRFGINGKLIRVYKFRTMVHGVNHEIGEEVRKDDARVTWLGKILRKTSLDEIPQFINVLQGRMSVVGPRPHAKVLNDRCQKLVPSYMKRHFVPPGITGWAQVNGYRGEANTMEKMLKRTEYDLYYLNHWSLTFDLKIIALSFFKGFLNKNAY